MLHLLFKMLLPYTVRWIKRDDVILLGILQYRGNGFKVFLHRSLLDAFPAPSGSLTEFFTHFFQRHR